MHCLGEGGEGRGGPASDFYLLGEEILLCDLCQASTGLPRPKAHYAAYFCSSIYPAAFIAYGRELSFSGVQKQNSSECELEFCNPQKDVVSPLRTEGNLSQGVQRQE